MTDQTRPTCTLPFCTRERTNGSRCNIHADRWEAMQTDWRERARHGDPTMPQFGACAVPYVVDDVVVEWHMDCPTCRTNTGHATKQEAQAAARAHECQPKRTPRPGQNWQEWELDVVRGARTPNDAVTRLPHRPTKVTRRKWNEAHPGRDRGYYRIHWTPDMDATLARHSNSQRRAAAALGVSQHAVHRRLRQLRDEGQQETAA